MKPERLSKLTAEIDAFGRATISRADLAAFEAIGAALIEARAFVAADLRGTLGCVCVLDPVTHEPIESTIDPEEVEHVAHIKGVLARIDAALGGRVMADPEHCHDALSDDFDVDDECPNCGGAGIVWGCFEDTCVCIDKDGYGCDPVRCDWCRPMKAKKEPTP